MTSCYSTVITLPMVSARIWKICSARQPLHPGAVGVAAGEITLLGARPTVLGEAEHRRVAAFPFETERSTARCAAISCSARSRVARHYRSAYVFVAVMVPE